MRFHSILFVRDEADVIEQSLTHNAKWCDHIYVYDTGSTDETWDIVMDCASRYRQIVPVQRSAVWWHDGLRAMVFNQFRERSEDGDWWIRLDGDEFYHVSPRDFVKELEPHESAIYHAYYNFKLTDQEAQRLSSRESIMKERESTVPDRRRHYVTYFDHGEPRFFRYRRSMQWNPEMFAPFNAGYVASKRIPIRHYPHRDPLQMERRFFLRKAMLEEMSKRSSSYATHWNVSDWRTELISASDPTLRFWANDKDPLPECTVTNHLQPPLKRTAQRMLYSLFLPVLDARRPKYPEGFRPEPLPDSLQTTLGTIK